MLSRCLCTDMCGGIMLNFLVIIVNVFAKVGGCGG